MDTPKHDNRFFYEFGKREGLNVNSDLFSIISNENKFFYELGKCSSLFQNPDAIFDSIVEQTAGELLHTIFLEKKPIKDLDKIERKKLRMLFEWEPLKENIYFNHMLRGKPEIEPILENIDDLLKDTLSFSEDTELEDSIDFNEQEYGQYVTIYQSLPWYNDLNPEEKDIIDYLFDTFFKNIGFLRQKLWNYNYYNIDVFPRAVFDKFFEKYQDPEDKLFYLSSLNNQETFTDYKELLDLDIELQWYQQELEEIQKKIASSPDDLARKHELESLINNIKPSQSLSVFDVFLKNKSYSEVFITGDGGIPLSIKVEGIDTTMEQLKKTFFRALFFNRDTRPKFSFGYIFHKDFLHLKNNASPSDTPSLTLDVSKNFLSKDWVAFVFLYGPIALVFNDFKQLHRFANLASLHRNKNNVSFNYFTKENASSQYFNEKINKMFTTLLKDEKDTIFQIILEGTKWPVKDNILLKVKEKKAKNNE